MCNKLQLGWLSESEKVGVTKKKGSNTLNLFDHLVFDDGITIENFHGDTLTGLRVLRELNLSKVSFSNCPSHLVLPYFPHRHFFAHQHCTPTISRTEKDFTSKAPPNIYYVKALLTSLSPILSILKI